MDIGLIVALGATLVAASVGVLAGFGLGLVLIPILAVVYTPREAVITVIVLAMGNSMLGLFADFKTRPRPAPDWTIIRHGLIGAVVIAVPAALTAAQLTSRAITAVLAIFVLITTFLFWRGWTPTPPLPRGSAALAGAVSQAAGIFAGTTGPPFVLYTFASGIALNRVRTTMQTFFLATNVITIVSLWLTVAVAPLWVIVAVGVVASGAVAPFRSRVPQNVLRPTMLILCALAGTTAGINALTG